MKLMIKMAVVRDLELNSLKITPVTNVKPPLIRKNWAGEIFLFVNTMPTLKSCNCTRKINQDNSEVKHTLCNYYSTPCNLILFKIWIARCSNFLDKNRYTCDN